MNAREWLAHGHGDPDVVVIGAPISRASISPSDAWSTPPAFREALSRFPLWDAEHGLDIGTLRVRDLGDVVGDRDDESAGPAHERIAEGVTAAAATGAVVVVVGGDNSLTRPAMTAMMAGDRAPWGLLTLDAHHDVRPADGGSSNGSPVRELIDAGLPGRRVAQVGIHPFGNRREFGAWAEAHGIHVHRVASIRVSTVTAVVREAIYEITDAGAARIYADLDVDTVERASAPACPASMPGGMSADDFCEAAYILGADPRVRAFDLCEVDAGRDVNGITVRLMAQAFMSICAGIVQRKVVRA